MTRNNRISASIEWNLTKKKKNDVKYYISVVDLHRRKFCDGRIILDLLNGNILAAKVVYKIIIISSLSEIMNKEDISFITHRLNTTLHY